MSLLVIRMVRLDRNWRVFSEERMSFLVFSHKATRPPISALMLETVQTVFRRSANRCVAMLGHWKTMEIGRRFFKDGVYLLLI